MRDDTWHANGCLRCTAYGMLNAMMQDQHNLTLLYLASIQFQFQLTQPFHPCRARFVALNFKQLLGSANRTLLSLEPTRSQSDSTAVVLPALRTFNSAFHSLLQFGSTNLCINTLFCSSTTIYHQLHSRNTGLYFDDLTICQGERSAIPV